MSATILCGGCDERFSSIEAYHASGHALGTPCPTLVAKGPCPDAKGHGRYGGDHHCASQSLSSFGCPECDWTGMCKTCAGTGYANPSEADRALWAEAAADAAEARRERGL